MGNWSEYLANGVRVNPGEAVPQRKELRNLSDAELYLLREGLAKFQNELDMNDPKSWFQIAGIHGMPYETWPNKGWNNDIPKVADNNQFLGFCTHSSIIFLPWHRPFLALFESILYKHVQDIANGIDSGDGHKKTYTEAAKGFRLPYWDWARREVNAYFPEEAQDETYDRTLHPESTASWFYKGRNSVYNPLFFAPFPDGVKDTRITQGQKHTRRYPEARDEAKATLERFIKDFYKNPTNVTKAQKNLSERVAYILNSYSRYGPMSNNQYQAESGSLTAQAEIWGSLEDIHNSLHGLIGGRGQMADPAISAFDPIFWLHHANIDRLFAIWQALHEKSDDAQTWVTEQTSGWGGWAIKANAPENTKTPLYPFRPSEGLWYNSTSGDDAESLKTSVKRTEPFGYAYPELSGLKYPLSKEDASGLRDKIDDYYDSASKVIRDSKKRIEVAGAQLLPQAEVLKSIAAKKVTADHVALSMVAAQLPEPQVLLQRSIGPGKPVLRDLAPNNEYLEWLVNIKAEKHSHGGKYSVHVFLGPVEEDNITLWPLSPHYVGSFVPFGQDSNTGCGNCQDAQRDRMQITSQIPLTLALVERYLAQILPDITEETVKPYLTKNLHWRVESEGTALANRAAIDGLTVFVVSNKVTLPEDGTQLPIYDPNVTIHPEITTNKDGGGRGNGTGLTVGVGGEQ